jgi:hypothetical protein
VIFDQSPIHFKAHFMCLGGLHIANLKSNKSLKFELLGSRALITHLHNKASITSFNSMRPIPPIFLLAQQLD